jgi:DNA-binding response OmpR family regulator
MRRDRRQALIVDDDESIRSLLKLFFEQEGYAVETVANGERALERFEVGRFHLVMLDYYMPGMNGLEVASAIHVQDPGVTIALITGMAHTLANVDLASTGITKVFSKPFDMCEMATWLQSLSNRG